MSGTGKSYRLSKLAKEFNISTSTIVEFFGGKGIEVDTNPNTKVDQSAYEMLQGEFQGEKSLKEQTKTVSLKREKRETISLDDDKDSETSTPPAAEVDSDADSADTKSSAATEIKEVKIDVDKKVKTEKPESTDGVHVLGRIDLDAINDKRPTKKAKPKKEEKEVKAKEVKVTKEVKEAPAKKEEAPKKPAAKEVKETPKPAPKKEEPKVEAPKEPETIKANATKLSGPTVVGKIELPVQKERSKKKPVASSTADSDDKKKRKRKRIKVDVSKEADKSKANVAGNNANARKKKKGRTEVDKTAVDKELKQTLASMSGGGKSKSSKFRRQKRDDAAQRREKELMNQELEAKVLKVTEFITVSEVATMMEVSSTELISNLMSVGVFASINQRLDSETLQLLAEEYGYEVEFVGAEVNEGIEEIEDKEEDLAPRSPIVTVMGHVDHGKTSLLDYIRKANVIAGEAGGITQHIGAYNVTLDNGKNITFLDTPGHEAFTAMRARGAQVTDVVIIIIAADDSIMPQTKEAINHAQAAGVPMIIAINKVDKPAANPDKVREELSTMNILVEDWGGKYQCQEISAKSGLGIPELLEKVTLESEILELKANPDRIGKGTVLESSLDKGKGYVTNILNQTGTLKVGDTILAGCYAGKIRAMFNERGANVKEAGPSVPVSILGLDGAPSAGDGYLVMTDEKEAKNIASKRKQLLREQGVRTQKHLTLDEIGRRMQVGDFQELNILIKGDVDGSIEALSDSLQKLSTDEIQINIIHKGVGQISESDVLLASASDAIIIGFQVRPSAGARKIADNENIEIRLYSIIYQAIDDMKDAMEGMLSPELKEEIIGYVEVRETFRISKVGTVAGCYVTEGKILRNEKIRVIRDGIVIYEGALGQLKRFKDDVKEVKFGYECGLSIEKFNDLLVGDQIESFMEVEVKRTL